jgi:hypothetical protein
LAVSCSGVFEIASSWMSKVSEIRVISSSSRRRPPLNGGHGK